MRQRSVLLIVSKSCIFTLGSMGFFEKAKALANEVADVGNRAVKAVTEQVNEVSEKNEQVGKIVKIAHEKTKQSIEIAIEKTDEVSEHAAGKSAGKIVRKVGEVAGNLPILSAAMDIVQAKNCVDILVRGVREKPSDPYSCIWLAESLKKTSEEMNKYRYVRNVMDPTSVAVGKILQKTAEFGKESLPLEEKVLRRAWQLAMKQIHLNPRNSSALDILARVYLAKDNKDGAVATAKAAVLADKKNPVARVTLSRALLEKEKYDEAFSMGMSAVKVGSTVGFLYAAEAKQLGSKESDEASLKERLNNYEDTANQVTEDDLRLYRGAYRTSGEVSKIVKSRQSKKVSDAINTGKRWTRIIKNA